MAQAEIFQYPLLQNPAQEIRLLRILPPSDESDDAGISVTLEHYQRGETLIYDALSYTWGDASKTKSILVNGFRFNATENLHSALSQLRKFEDTEDYSRSELIWIDALCINQHDNAEKSVQVQMMRDIFAEAAQVIIWLGIPTEEYSLGMDTISTLAEAYDDYNKAREDNLGNAGDLYEELLTVLREFLTKNHESKGDLTDSVNHIFAMPWWDRVWIIQEVAVAKQSWVIFGDEVLGFEYFRHLYNAINKLEEIEDEEVAAGWSLHIQQISACTNRVNSVLKTWLHEETSLLDAIKTLFVSGSSQATHPSDRFYALMGLRVNVEEIVGPVNYTIPWQELYTNAAQNLLKKHGPSILSFCVPSDEQSKVVLPSWVPDWTQYITFPLAFRSLSKMYSASGSTSQNMSFQADNKELILQGIRIATIRKVEEQWSLPPASRNTYPWASGILAMKAWHQCIVGLASSLKLPDLEREEVVMRTTTACLFENDVADFRRLRTEDRSAYEAFLRLLSLPLPSDPGFSYEEVASVNAVASDYTTGLFAAAEMKKPFLGDGGRIGIGPGLVDIGDIVCVLFGASVPFILRPADDGKWRLLGEAYVDGIMDGEALDSEKLIAETFVLC